MRYESTVNSRNTLLLTLWAFCSKNDEAISLSYFV